MMELPTFDDVRAAAERIAPHAHKTPVLCSSQIDERVGASLYFKCESLQRIGAFKFRGACNAVFALDERTAARGVITHSSGNHGQALALAAKIRKIPATVVMPENSSRVKVAAVEGYGARIVFCAPGNESREQAAQRVIEQTGATLVHPYDDANVIAGQGTACLELLSTVERIDAVIAPVGGGGLMSGTALAAHGLSPRIELYGAEPEVADDARQSLAQDRIVSIPPFQATATIADGLRTTAIGARTFAVMREHVAHSGGILTVAEDEIVAAMRLVWERMKLVIEPSAAVPVAALLARRELFAGKRVGVILSGGNVDLDRLPWASGEAF